MKVVCVDNNITDIKILKYKMEETKNRWNITIDKVYEIDHIGMNNIRVINDKGVLFSYPKECFMTIDEYRNKRLEEIGI